MESPSTPPVRSELDELAHAREQIRALTAEVAALKADREEAVLEAQEAAARLRNMLAGFRAVFRRTLEGAHTLEDVSLHLTERFDAMARYGVNTLVGRPVDLENVVRDQLLRVAESDGPQTTISGPPVALSFRQASLMSLAVHELVINSIKFGALAAERASLSVRWEIAGAEDDLLNFVWTETGVAVLASAPMREGFGRQYIEQGLPYQLGAEASFVLQPGGIRCAISLPGIRPGPVYPPIDDEPAQKADT